MIQEWQGYFNEVEAELVRQRHFWGKSTHEPGYWLLLLQKQLGQAAHAITSLGPDSYKRQLIEIAALSIAAAQCLQDSGHVGRRDDYWTHLPGGAALALVREYYENGIVFFDGADGPAKADDWIKRAGTVLEEEKAGE